ncbi:hypothetical protein ACFXAZ_06765 [Streptomyces sp. NPDC059477]|uniref:hypothetical protein n=1 Tax=Streptomyces sp. NPDC059477 TaxID=3346847 RepID=UPI0036936C92
MPRQGVAVDPPGALDRSARPRRDVTRSEPNPEPIGGTAYLSLGDRRSPVAVRRRAGLVVRTADPDDRRVSGDLSGAGR